MAVTLVAYGPIPNIPAGYSNTIAARGLAKTGISASRASVDVQKLLDLIQWTVSGTFTAITTAKGGGVRNNGTAQASLQRGTAAVGRIPIAAAGTDKFYVAFIFKLAAGAFTAGAGQSILLLFTDASGNGFYLGAENSTISAAKFGCYSFNGAVGAVASTVSIDANWHVAELWFDGTNYKFAVDNETPLSLTVNLPAGGTALNLGLRMQPLGTAADMQCTLLVSVTDSEGPAL